MDSKVTFHTDSLGDLSLSWDKVKELHASEKFAVLDKSVKPVGKKQAAKIPVGSLDVENQSISLHAEQAPPPIPIASAAYVVDEATLNKDIYREPGFFDGWNGAATAGATVVESTQNQFTASGSVGLVRSVPGVSWLKMRNRTSVDFSGSYGKISQPGTPEIKSALYHADAERDEYVSPRFFALGQVAFDHNFSQDLALQSIYGGGFGYTVFASSKHQLDVKGTAQYENQQFIVASGHATASPSLNLIGSTFALNYAAKLKLFTLTQSASFIPSWNVMRAYSANETDTVAFPVYKNLSFSLGTMDSYLNNPPASTPPEKHNSFEFTMGVTYAIKSKY
jgi:hypothetical protein